MIRREFSLMQHPAERAFSRLQITGGLARFSETLFVQLQLLDPSHETFLIRLP